MGIVMPGSSSLADVLDEEHSTGFHPAAELRALYDDEKGEEKDDEEAGEGKEEKKNKASKRKTLVFRCTSWKVSTRFVPLPARLGTQLPVLDAQKGMLRLAGLPAQMEDVGEGKDEKKGAEPMLYVFGDHAILPPLATSPIVTRALLIERLVTKHPEWFPADAKEREHVLNEWERLRKTFGLAVYAFRSVFSRHFVFAGGNQPCKS